MTDPIKILFVDDEPDLVPLIQQRFRSQVRSGDVQLVFALDGVEALERLEEDPDIDVVVTDINMPRMDGLTLLGKLGELKRRTKAVVVTAYSDMENIRTAMNRGAFDFLTKPIDMADLQITVTQARAAVGREKEAARVRSIFTSLLSDPIAAAVLENFEMFQEGQSREVSVLMSDISGFSQLSERLPAERVVELLNVYLSAMTDVVERYGGAIDEFIGDAVLVIFGAPVASDDHAAQAVACAVAMQAEMRLVNERLTERGLPPLEMTAAVNTGEVVVGIIGSEKRAKYGVVGTPVNLTSRIQTLAAPGEVLISDITRTKAEGSGIETIETRHVSLKGIAEPVAVHNVGAAGGIRVPNPDESMEALAAPAPFTYAVLDGKQLSEREGRGTITRLSATRAAASLDSGPDGGPVPGARTDVRLVLDAAPDAPVYAKVLETPTGAAGVSEVQLRFAALPPAAAQALRGMAASPAAGAP